FSGTVAGREVWGMPLQQGDVTMCWCGDVLNVTAGRRGSDFVRFAVRLEHRIDPPASVRAPMATFATRRQVFEKDSADHVLIGLELAKAGCHAVPIGTRRDPTTFPEDEKAAGWRDVDSVAEEVRAVGRRATPLRADIADEGEVVALRDAILAEFGRVDILVNN